MQQQYTPIIQRMSSQPQSTIMRRIIYCLSIYILLCLTSLLCLSPLVDLSGNWSAAAQAAPHTETPDLVIRSITISPTVIGLGDVGDIEIVVQNQGALSATGFSAYLYVTPDTVPPDQETITTTRFLFDVPLLPGGVFTWTRTDHLFTEAESMRQPPHIYAWVDPPWEDRVAESNEQNNLFPNPNAAIVHLDPSHGNRGTSLAVTVTATHTHFLPGTTSVDLGPGIAISDVQVLSATQLIAELQIAEDALPRSRTVTLTTGVEVITHSAAFTVTAPVATPAITQIQPDHARPGTSIGVTITATNTHFLSDTTTADFGEDITIKDVTVISPTQVVIGVEIDANAMPGMRTVTLTTGTEEVRKESGFQVQSPLTKDAILSITPSPTTMLIGRMRQFQIILTPGTTPVNGVQIHGKVDPAFVRLVSVMSHTEQLGQIMDPVGFDPATGEFRFAAGVLGQSVPFAFPVLTLEIEALAVTPEGGTSITFLNSSPPTDVSGEEGSILQATQDGVIMITDDTDSAIIQGEVYLQGRPPKPHSSWSIPLTLQLVDLENENIDSIRERIHTDQWGKFRLEGLPIGLYQVRIKGDHTLGSRIEEVMLQPAENRLFLGTLLEGDVDTENSNNGVTAIDFGLLSGAMERCTGDVGYLAAADLDEVDDCVTIKDAALLASNFNEQGDRVYPTPDRVPAPLFAPEPDATLSFTLTEPVTGVYTIHADLYKIVELPLYVDPGNGDSVLGITGHYGFDPSALEVTGIDLSHSPPTLMMRMALDNESGSVRFSLVTQPEQGIHQKQQIGTLKVRLKAQTEGVTLTPILDGANATELAGANGSVMNRADSMTLISSSIGGNEANIFLPVITR